MALPADIVARIRLDFPGAERSVTELLLGYAGREPYRVMRCILFLAAGSIDRLRHEVKTAALDYRDTINFAEYNASGQHLRDLSRSFGAD